MVNCSWDLHGSNGLCQSRGDRPVLAECEARPHVLAFWPPSPVTQSNAIVAYIRYIRYTTHSYVAHRDQLYDVNGYRLYRRSGLLHPLQQRSGEIRCIDPVSDAYFVYSGTHTEAQYAVVRWIRCICVYLIMYPYVFHGIQHGAQTREKIQANTEKILY